MKGKFGVSGCKLLFIGWVNNKVLLYNTGSYIQYPVIKYKEKIYKRNTKKIYKDISIFICIYLYIYLYIYIKKYKKKNIKNNNV